MRALMDQVREFHTVGQLGIGEPWTVIDDGDEAAEIAAVAEVLDGEARLLARIGKGTLALRARLMVEELAETLDAMARGDVVEVADGLADLAYVTAGTAIEFGIPLDLVSDEVQRSKMAKFPPCSSCLGTGTGDVGGLTPCHAEGCCNGNVRVLDENGKVQKPEGWTPPDIAGVMEASRGI